MNIFVLFISTIISSNEKKQIQNKISSKYLFNQDLFGGEDNIYGYEEVDLHDNLTKIKGFFYKQNMINQLNNPYITNKTKVEIIEKYNTASIKPNFLRNIFENTDFELYDF